MGYLAGHNFLKKEDLTTRDDGSHEVEYACTKCGQTIYFIDKCADESWEMIQESKGRDQ